MSAQPDYECPQPVQPPPGWPIEPEYVSQLPPGWGDGRAQVVMYQPAPLPAAWQQPMQRPQMPVPAPVKDVWPMRMAGFGLAAAGTGVGLDFAGHGIAEAGHWLWAVAGILLAAGWLRHGRAPAPTGGGNITIQDSHHITIRR